ncbi:MAG: hypothetical protein Q4D79_05620 [Propionibacteriaceae bacterium]|nr:hypothetical protein [Propionibacteriaceae bacterium]
MKPAQPQPGAQPLAAQDDGPATELIQESATAGEDEATTERLPELPRQPQPSITERFPDLYRQPTSAASYPTPTLPEPEPAPSPGYPPPSASQSQGYAPAPPQGYSPQPPGYGPPQPGYGPSQPQGYAPIPPQGYGPQPGYGPYDPAYGYAPQGQPPYGYAPQAAPSPAAEPQPADEPRPKSGATAFWGIIAWRLVLAVLAAIPLFSLLEVASRPWELLNQLLYFTLLTDIVILLVNGYGVIRPLLLFWAAPHLRTEGRTAWARGLATTMGVFTAVIYATMLGGDYSGVSVIPHLILPVAMVIDWLFIGRAQGNNGLSAPITWVLLLAPYVGIYYWDATVDRPMYSFLNPSKDDFWPLMGAMVGSYAVLAVVVWLLGRLSSWIRHTAQG